MASQCNDQEQMRTGLHKQQAEGILLLIFLHLYRSVAVATRCPSPQQQQCHLDQSQPHREGSASSPCAIPVRGRQQGMACCIWVGHIVARRPGLVAMAAKSPGGRRDAASVLEMHASEMLSQEARASVRCGWGRRDRSQPVTFAVFSPFLGPYASQDPRSWLLCRLAPASRGSPSADRLSTKCRGPQAIE